MNDSDLIMIGFVLLCFLGIFVSFVVFGAELPVYLGVAISGLSLYIFSNNPILQIIGGWIGRLATILFIVSLVYYVSTGTFFPTDPIEFRFYTVGISFLKDFSNSIGNLVLGFFK